jgi:hypothetical protein
MTWKRVVVMLLALVVTSFVAFVLLDRLDVPVYLRGGIAFLAIVMVQRVVAPDYIRGMWLGHSWTAWFLSSLAIAIFVCIVMWRFWPR